MVVALFNGMALHESTIVVATYYISMTLFASVQGLCVFNLLAQFTPLKLVGDVFGMLLCVAAVLYMAGMRAKRLSGGGGSGGGRGAIGGVDRAGLIVGEHASDEAHCGDGGAPNCGGGRGDSPPVSALPPAMPDPNLGLQPLPASPTGPRLPLVLVQPTAASRHTVG